MTKKIKTNKEKFGIIRVTQVGSAIGRKYNQEAILIGLGLNKMHRSVELEASPSILGMVNKVRHLLKVDHIQ